MLNANEVRAMAKDYRESIEKTQKKKAIEFLDEKVMPTIERLARAGATYTFCQVPDEVPIEKVVEILTELGYKVLRRYKEIDISWE